MLVVHQSWMHLKLGACSCRILAATAPGPCASLWYREVAQSERSLSAHLGKGHPGAQRCCLILCGRLGRISGFWRLRLPHDLAAHAGAGLQLPDPVLLPARAPGS